MTPRSSELLRQALTLTEEERAELTGSLLESLESPFDPDAESKVMSATEYSEKYVMLHSEKEENRRKLYQILSESMYDELSFDDLDQEQKKEIEAYNLLEMLNEALGDKDSVDYQEVSFILGRLSSLQKPELIKPVLDNLERLYPVADAVASFFLEFKSLEKSTYEEIGEALLRPLSKADETRPSEFYAIWVLHIFAQHDRWNHGEQLLRVFRETSSDAIRRYAAIALATSGARAQAVKIKEYLNSGSPLCKTAMLLATKRLGKDERKFLKRSLQLHDKLELLCIDT